MTEQDLFEVNENCMNLVRKLSINPILKNSILTDMNKIKQFYLARKHEGNKGPVSTGSDPVSQ